MLSSPDLTIVIVLIGVAFLVLMFVPFTRTFIITLVGYLLFLIGLSIRYYILLPAGILRGFIYLSLAELTDILSGDPNKPLVKISRPYLPHLLLHELQRYNGLGDQVPSISILLIRYTITAIIYIGLLFLYLFLKNTYGFNSPNIERTFLVLALGIVVNMFSNFLYYIIDRVTYKSEPIPEPKVQPPDPVPNTTTLYRLVPSTERGFNGSKINDIMHIYKNSAPILERMQRNDLTIRPFFIAYRSGDQDYFQYEESFNIIDLIKVVNTLPVIDEISGMIQYCIYYRDGKSYYKTEYMTREGLRILAKAVMSIYNKQ